MRPGCDDRLERETVEAGTAKSHLNGGRNLPFLLPTTDRRERRLRDLGQSGSGFPQRGLFVCVLHETRPFHHPLGRPQLNLQFPRRQRRPQPVVPGDGEVRCLESGACDAKLRQAVDKRLVVARRNVPDTKARAASVRILAPTNRLGVAEINQQVHGVAGQHEDAGRAHVVAEVIDVRRVGDDQRVDRQRIELLAHAAMPWRQVW